MIQLCDAAKSFGPRLLWTEVTLSVGDGEMVALVGPSGSGKSTMLNCLGLLERLDAGGVLVDGTDVPRRSARRFRRDRLGYLFQSYALIESATIRQNLDVVLRARDRLRRADTRRRQAEALEAVGLEGREATPVFTLSGGEQQRVALARLVLKQPSVILADEPTGALDAANARMVVATLRSFADRGASVVVATHSDEVMESCDRVVDVRDFARAPRLPEKATASGPELSATR